MEQEKKEFNKDQNDLQEIKEALVKLAEKIDQQDFRIRKIEEIKTGEKEKPEFDQSYFSAPPPPPPPEKEDQIFEDISKKSDWAPKEKIGLEENIGATWFARIGITALILGISFFLKYAFDNDWIGETGRVIIGILIGVSLLGLGEKYIRKYEIYGQIISGGGIAVLYLSIFSAFSFYDLIGHYPAFFFMALVTIAGIVLSLRYNAISLIVVSTLGGFATPFLISGGQDNMLVIFSYVLLLDLAVLAVSIFKKWRTLNFIGFFGTFFIFYHWMDLSYKSGDFFFAMFFLTLFFITYSISSMIYNLVKKENSTGIEQGLTILSAVVYFLLSYFLIDGKYPEMMGFFTLLLAIYYFAWANLTKMITPEDKNLYNFLAFLTVGFATVAILVQFEGIVITLALAIEALLLFFLGSKTQKDSFKGFGLAVFGLVLFRLMFFDSFNEESLEAGWLAVFNGTFLTFLFVIIISYILAFVSKTFSLEEERGDIFLRSKQTLILFLIVANLLTVFAVSREIEVYWKKEIRILSEENRKNNLERERYSPSTRTDYNLKGYSTYSEQVKKMRNKSSLYLSIFWLIYGIILVIFGIAMKNRVVRLGGMGLLLLAILKLFFYDLWELGTLYRIISSISLGVVLLGISFVYQKHKDKLKEII
jgi:uncharacterized membrane protein